MSARERILSAAMSVFSRYGYRAASMELVAEEVGVTRQALYHHFSSKEALFRAVVEALHEGAAAAEIAAGRSQEQAGASLAEILAAQISARFGYILKCVTSTPQAEELLSEHLRRTRDLYAKFVEQNFGLRLETIERVCARQRLSMRDGITPSDLARCIQMAIRAFDLHTANVAAIEDLECMVRLLVHGALLQTPTTL